MKIKEFEVKLDIKSKVEQELFEVVQGDSNSNLVRTSLYYGLEPFDLTGTTIEIVFRKADGKTVQQTDATVINETAGKFQCILKTNTIACPGKVAAEVRILDGETLLTSAKFGFYVRKALINDETVESSDEFPVLTQLMATTEGLIAQVELIEKQVPENVLIELGNKIDKASIAQTDLVNDETKVPSSAVTFALGKEIDTINNNLDPLKLGLHMIKNIAVSGVSATLSYEMAKSDFNSIGTEFKNTGTYLLVTTSWGTVPSTGLYLISYSGGNVANSALTTIVAQDGATVTATSGVISASGSMARIRLYAFS